MATLTAIEDIIFEDVVYDVPVYLIDHDDDWNCRGRISAQECIDLARDIRENGQQAPGQLRIYDEPRNGKPFGLISGFRRFHSIVVLNNDTTYRAIFKKDVDDFTAKALNFSENDKRRNLNILQEASVFKYFQENGFTEPEIMQKCNVSRGYLQPRIMLLRMPKEIQDLAAIGILKATNIRDLNSFLNPQEQLEAAREFAKKKKLGVKAFIKKPKVSKRPKSQLKMNRTPKQVRAFQEHLFDQGISAGFHSRCLAWSSGVISDADLYDDIEDYATDICMTDDFREMIKQIDPNRSDYTEVGKLVIDFINNFSGVNYERPENGFPIE